MKSKIYWYFIGACPILAGIKERRQIIKIRFTSNKDILILNGENPEQCCKNFKEAFFYRKGLLELI